MATGRSGPTLKLVITDDEGRTTVVPLDREEVSIGRGEGNTIRLTERNVSRKHAILRRTARGYEIEDLKSYTGTKIGGIKIVGAQPLRDGERVQIGDYQITMQSARQPLRVGPDGKTGQITADADTALLAMPEDRPPPPAAPRPIGKPRFVVEVGPSRGRQFVIDRDELSIGQAPECEIRLDHPSVSRTHAKIVNVGGVRILDLNSTNGVRVNGREIPYAELEPGDLVELGEVKLRFIIPGLPSRTGAAPRSRRGAWLAAGIAAGFVIVGTALLVAWPSSGPEIVPDIAHPLPETTTPATASPTASVADRVTSLITAARTFQSQLAIDRAVEQAREAKELLEGAGLSTKVADDLLAQLEVDRRGLDALNLARERVASNPEEALIALDRLPDGSVAVSTSAAVAQVAAEAFNRQLEHARSLAREASHRDEARAEVGRVLAHRRLAGPSLPSALDQVRTSARELDASLTERAVAVGPRPPHPAGNGGHDGPTKLPNKVPDTPPRPPSDEAARWAAVRAAAGDPARYKRLACAFARDFHGTRNGFQAQQVCNSP